MSRERRRIYLAAREMSAVMQNDVATLSAKVDGLEAKLCSMLCDMMQRMQAMHSHLQLFHPIIPIPVQKPPGFSECVHTSNAEPVSNAESSGIPVDNAAYGTANVDTDGPKQPRAESSPPSAWASSLTTTGEFSAETSLQSVDGFLNETSHISLCGDDLDKDAPVQQSENTVADPIDKREVQTAAQSHANTSDLRPDRVSAALSPIQLSASESDISCDDIAEGIASLDLHLAELVLPTEHQASSGMSSSASTPLDVAPGACGVGSEVELSGLKGPFAEKNGKRCKVTAWNANAKKWEVTSLDGKSVLMPEQFLAVIGAEESSSTIACRTTASRPRSVTADVAPRCSCRRGACVKEHGTWCDSCESFVTDLSLTRCTYAGCGTVRCSRCATAMLDLERRFAT